MPATDGAYTPNPHYTYLGAPLGRSGNESASIPGTIYRNVWISTQPRPVIPGQRALAVALLVWRPRSHARPRAAPRAFRLFRGAGRAAAPRAGGRVLAAALSRAAQ